MFGKNLVSNTGVSFGLMSTVLPTKSTEISPKTFSYLLGMFSVDFAPVSTIVNSVLLGRVLEGNKKDHEKWKPLHDFYKSCFQEGATLINKGKLESPL